jgi:hypothetical protein
MLDASQEDGVIAFLMARVGRALEGRNTAAQPWTTSNAVVEVIPPVREFIGGRPGKVHRDWPLGRRQHAQNEVTPADERIGAPRIITDAPQDEWRVEGH